MKQCCFDGEHVLHKASKMLRTLLLLLVVFHVKLIAEGDKGNFIEAPECELKDNTPGVCRLFHECEFAMKNAKRGQPPEICKDDAPKVCCKTEKEAQTESPAPSVSTTSTTTFTAKNSSRSLEMCKEYGKSVFIELPSLTLFDKPRKISQCGFNTKPLVIGGEKAKPKEFPHMAILGYKIDNEVKWLCGGSLISDLYVLSAAHCTKPNNSPKWVQLGVTDLNNRNNTGSFQEFQVEDIIRHPDYFKNSSKYNDIALIKLDHAALFNAYVRPACLYTEHQIATRAAIAAGWGFDELYNKVTDLMKVELSIVPPTKCNETYYRQKLRRHLPIGIDSTTQLCAGDPGKDTCKGDSGGPLQIFRFDVECMYSLIGITSFGLVCGASPGVYTLLSHYVPWIENIVWP